MKKKITFRQIVALCGIILLVGMYGMSLVAACLARPEAADLFLASLALTVLIPILLYVLLMFSRLSKGDGAQGKGMKYSELRRYNKRMKNGEDPETIAKEIEEKYGREETEEGNEEEGNEAEKEETEGKEETEKGEK